MFENIFVGIIVTIVVATAIWAWWIDNRSNATDTETEKENKPSALGAPYALWNHILCVYFSLLTQLYSPP